MNSVRLDLNKLRQRLRQERPVDRDATPPAAGPHAPLDEVVGGSDAGGFHLVSQRYEATRRHGQVPLGCSCEADGESLALLARNPALASFDLEEALFLDLETNGLAGGAGTYAFLVGVAFWQDGVFIIQQYFMRHPGEEGALLEALTPLLEARRGFVTFNGKSFDLPVLEGRFILNRRPRPLRSAPHLDLLHPARRLWKRRLADCTLGTLEREILGARRSEADVPGYLVPHLYHQYLRQGDAAPLAGIFYHNQRDLLALAALAGHMARLCRTPREHASRLGCDQYSLGRLYEESGRVGEAEEAYRQALAAPMAAAIREECHYRLSILLKRQGRWDEASALWREIVGSGLLYPYVELAKYHEHQRRAPAAAERAVRAALSAAAEGRLRLNRIEREALLHRLARLERKQARAAAPL